MSGTEAWLYLIGVPVVVVAVVWALAYRGGESGAKRYRPGRPYTFAPVWYVANHRSGTEVSRPALGSDRERAALPAGTSERSDESGPVRVGGASEQW